MAVAQLVRALDCDSGGRGFKSPQPPHLFNDLAKHLPSTPSLTPSLTFSLKRHLRKTELVVSKKFSDEQKYMSNYFCLNYNVRKILLNIIDKFYFNVVNLTACQRPAYPRYTLATGGTGCEHRQQTSAGDRRKPPMRLSTAPCDSGGRGFKSPQSPHSFLKGLIFQKLRTSSICCLYGGCCSRWLLF